MMGNMSTSTPRLEDEPAFYRVQIKNHKLERVASLKDVKRTTIGKPRHPGPA